MIGVTKNKYAEDRNSVGGSMMLGKSSFINNIAIIKSTGQRINTIANCLII